ncbi:uncharacterized protein CTRU02_214478 [Colletotrichum truncatum]|uniref:Uncharacterized protein n=1 Tax=Colletotrichum truncatum TaxID=5467 RepID=A0ACC3YEX5_COLTU|nr:uncharacterized protein CTRU02_12148 [Colletotrichum truncatum]KAF6784937.1 hypothetical protein CTRU02_12148 [Colletotrichum truncatum]
MVSPSTNIVLRKISIISFVPAFIILFIHGIISSCPFPALGILPLSASAVLGLFIVRRDFIAALGSPIQALSPSNIFFADLFLGVFHFIFLLISWVVIREPWDRGQIVLGTYGTVPLMVNTGIHFYVLIPQIAHMFSRRTCDCPHCQSVNKPAFFSSSTSEYTPLNEDDTEPEDIGRDLEAGH